MIKKLFSIMFLMLVGLVLTGCGEKPAPDTDDDIVVLPQSEIKDVKTVIIKKKLLIKQLKSTGVVKSNEDKVFLISALAPGQIVNDIVKLGDKVRKGQILAYIRNPEVLSGYSSYLHQLHEAKEQIKQATVRKKLAVSSYQRESSLFNEGISPKKDYLAAQAELKIAESNLNYAKEHYHHTEMEAKSLMSAYGVSFDPHSESIKTTSPIQSLGSGVVTKKNVIKGQVVAPNDVLYEITDLSQLWLDLNIFAKDFASIKEGQEVIFVPDSYPNESFSGHIGYIHPTTNDSTNTFVARVFINNPNNRLTPGMFGAVTIKNDMKKNLPFVPDEALQHYGKETFVFVELAEGKYKKYPVEIASATEEGSFIEQGIKENDKVVTAGSFKLKSEMLKKLFTEDNEE